MPDEIEARISIAVESAKAEQGISAVKQSVGELTRARWKMLDAMKAERTLARKLDAGYPITAEEMARASAATRRLREEYEALKASRRSAASPAQNFSAVSAAAKTAVTGINAAGKATQKLTLRMIAAKSAARAFGVSFRGFAPQMALLSVASKVGGMVSEVVKEAWGLFVGDKIGARERELASLREYNGDILYSRLAERRENFKSAFSVIKRLNSNEGALNEAQRMELSNAMAELGVDFKRLGISVDKASGKFIDAANAVSQIRERELLEERKRLVARRKELNAAGNQALLKANNGIIFDENTGEVLPAPNRGVAVPEWQARLFGATPASFFAEADKNFKEISDRIMPKIKQIDRELGRIPGQIQVQRKRIELAERDAAAEKLKRDRAAVNAAESTALQAAQRIAAEQFKYRSTLMSGVESGSMEALRLRSRVMINTDTSPAQKAASGIRVLVDQGKVLDQRLQTLSGQVSQLVTNTRNTAGALTGGRQY